MSPRKGLNGLVVKIASRCNLNCSYCYMYNMGDESYRQLPKIMTDAVVDQLIERTARHCEDFKLRDFELILHGGEPLLAGKSFLIRFVEKAKKRFEEKRMKLRIGIQTNGVLLDEEWCKLLSASSISIGISIDGPAGWHDKYRKDHQLNGTHAKTLLGLRAAQNEKCKVGVLSVMNASSDPRSMYDYFNQLSIDDLDFLWPDHNYEKLPELYIQRSRAPGYTPFGDWWIRLFDCWFADRFTKPRIRFLNQVILMILGRDAGFESIGQEENRYLIVETDGGIEASDYLKACGNGFTKEGLNVRNDEFSEAFDTPLMKMHRQSHLVMSETCMQCKIREVCGGGHIAHRFGNGNGFDNPSIYCFDLMKLLTHIQNRLLGQLSTKTIREAGLVKMSYEDVLKSINMHNC
ncbi:radical SAM protein [Dyadobacter sp. LJ53]|uniref:radical SAM protein n=1 Tax=Dyadobacter chenwenxiniae TaxID=2906456 RepID=UPI001F270DC0|nr:radical SAM protein [Dyadobacter chenwenxiniae]MCF0052411.1 radical SAM protein [Dyadobacter chenwenxiniae]